VGRGLDPTTLEASTRATKTKDDMARQVRVHAVAWFGKVELGKLRPQDLEPMIVSLRAGKRPGQPDREAYKPWSVRHTVQAAKAATADAVRDGLLARDPFAVVKLPKAASDEARFLTTPEEAQALLQVIKGDRLEALWLTMLGLGLRRGEVIGLRWSGVDLESGQL
jgi:integrase